MHLSSQILLISIDFKINNQCCTWFVAPLHNRLLSKTKTCTSQLKCRFFIGDPQANPLADSKTIRFDQIFPVSNMFKWINETVPETGVRKLDVDIGDVIDKKGVHYGSRISYVCAKVENDDGEEEEYDFVIKYGFPEIRGKLPLHELFAREIDVYTKLLPKYQELELEKGLEPISFLPKCFKAEHSDSQEVVIFEDLRKMGFVLRNNSMPMNLEHVKAILQCYGKWHALSFAFKDQKPQDYGNIVGAWSRNNPFKNLIQGHIGDWMNIAHDIFLNILDKEMLKKYKDKINNLDLKSYFLQLFDEHIDQSVVVHGDCSFNNFMFKYESSDLDESFPEHVKILDFQASHLNSPVFDLSFFIFTSSSGSYLEFIRELLEHYYTSFADHLTRLGSNPKEVFTFADLVSHWDKYSAVGPLFNPFIVALSLSNEDQVPDVAREGDFKKWLDVTKTEEFRERVLVVARNFVSFEFL